MRMISRQNGIDGKRMLTEVEAFTYAGMGRTAFRAWAREIGAVRHFGRSVRYDLRVIEKALDDLDESNREDEIK